MSNTKQKNDADLQQTFDIFNNNKDVNKDIKMESKNMDIKNNINNIESLEDITGQTPNHQEANEELELSEEQKQKSQKSY